MPTIELMKNEETKDRGVLNVSLPLKAKFKAVVKAHEDKQKVVIERLVAWFVAQDKHTQSFIINGMHNVPTQAKHAVIEAIAASIIQQGEAWDAHLQGLGSDAVSEAIGQTVDQQQDANASHGPGLRRARGG